MTDNEIIKALKCCFNGYCRECAFDDNLNLNCKDRLIENALNLIESQKAEIDELQLKNSSCILENAELKAEIDRLLRSLNETNKYIPKIKERAKTEAIKEFADRLKEENNNRAWFCGIFNNDIDNLVKEMTESGEGDGHKRHIDHP